MTTSWKWLTGIALLAMSFAAGWLVNSWRLSASFSEAKLAVVQVNADHFRNATENVNESAKRYLQNAEPLKKQIAALKKELSDAKKNNLVPADCKPDADRLRVLQSAVAAANRATTGQ